MSAVDVRRLAAIDMYGTRGTTRRRRIILTEFIAGAIVMIGFGVWLTTAAGPAFDRALGIYIVLAGLNYVPLALHGVALSRPGALDQELSGVDTFQEIRRYGLLQFWIFVPLSLVVMASRQVMRRRSS
jgi:hypothetical protein